MSAAKLMNVAWIIPVIAVGFFLGWGWRVIFHWTATIPEIEFCRGYDRPIFWPMVDGTETWAGLFGDQDTVVADPVQLEELICGELEFYEKVPIEFFCWSNDIPFIFRSGEFHPAKGGAE